MIISEQQRSLVPQTMQEIFALADNAPRDLDISFREQMILPSRPFPDLTGRFSIDLGGIPNSGKSTLVRALSKTPNFTAEEETEPIEEKGWIGFDLAYSGVQSWLMQQVVDFPFTPAKEVYLLERGPIDALARHIGFEDNRNVPLDPALNMNPWTLSSLGYYNAIILMNIDFDEYVNRRLAKGSPPTSMYVNENTWDSWRYSYAWLIEQYFYGYAKDKLGQGLLVLDGTRSTKDKLGQITYFLKQCNALP